MKSPFFKVTLEGDSPVDITDRVERFVYEDAIEEDNYLGLTIKSNFSAELTDDNELDAGRKISFMFGYIGLERSETHKAKITDILPKYNERVTLTVKCLDLGTTIKKVGDNKIWENVTSSDIAKTIADKYGLTLVVDKTTKKWDNLPQGNRSDLGFLHYLAKREAGNYTVFIRNENLYFVKRAINVSSRRTFEYNNGDGVVTSFEPAIKESSASPSSSSVKMAISDPTKASKASDIANVSVDHKNEEKTGTTGAFKGVYDAFSNKLGTTTESTTPSKVLVDPTKDKTEATNLANSLKKSTGLKEITAKLTIEGDPTLVPNEVITMKNVAKKFSGNWYVIKVTHEISTGGYKTILELNRNGLSAKTGTKATDANTSVGKDGKDDKKVLRVYSGDRTYLGRTNDPDKRTIVSK